MCMNVAIKLTLVGLIGFAAGLLVTSAPARVVQIQKRAESLTIRDSYFKKCAIEGATMTRNATEETWACGSTKFFIVRNQMTVLMEGAK